MALTRHADTLRLVAARLGLPTLRQTVARPGVNEGLRVSVYHPKGGAPDSVATLQRGLGANCQLTAVYDKYDSRHQRYTYNFTIPLARYQQLLNALRTSRFDTMDDAPDVPILEADTWLIERGSGSFYHDIVLSPANAVGHHRELVMAIRQHLPEAVRQLVL